jgi:AP-1-like factor
MVFGNIRDPVGNRHFNDQNFDWVANQNGGQFNPEIFGDYREPQNAIAGNGDFTGGFFNDSMPTMDSNFPFYWSDLTAPTGLTPAINRSNPLEQADPVQAGSDENLVTCTKMWDYLQERSDFKDGSLDIDGLCSELRAQARCSESGVVIDQEAFDRALQRLSRR